MKTCPDCKQAKPVDQFWKDKRTRDGVTVYCTVCARARNSNAYRARVKRNGPSGVVDQADMRAYRARWYQENKVEQAARNRAGRLKKYGITPEDYDRMLQEQGGGCAACGSTETGWSHAVFPVDHDHVTGKTRALLCNGCNVALGAVNDDAARLLALLAYLERHAL